MAKKKAGGPNKSQAIRDYLKNKPDAGPTEIVKELKKKGMTLTPALVSNVKAAMLGKKPGKKKRRGKPGPKPGSKRVASISDKVSLSSLIEAREFVDKVGGVDQAQALLKALGKLG
ncbi:hypothetical protein MalM25_02460 [Planctomycetes bacterium MalM25]|nr:hypothetical protein MalM25_02460 [Planctomycetes bacterium MalM25]